MYRSATPGERRAVHLALAEATDREVDPDRHAWHLAAAAPGPDEDIAVELVRSAGRAQAGGRYAAAAAFLQRGVALTPEPAQRSERALAAAQASVQAGRVRCGARFARDRRGRGAGRPSPCPGGPTARAARVLYELGQ